MLKFLCKLDMLFLFFMFVNEVLENYLWFVVFEGVLFGDCECIFDFVGI